MAPETRFARVAIAPVFPSEAGLAAFGLTIDRVRFVVVRPITRPDTLADTTVDLPPDAQTLDLKLRVPIVSSPETVLVSGVAQAGAVPLFQGTAPVEVQSGFVSQPTDIPVQTYVGPGSGVDSIAISPRAPFIYWGDSLRFQVQAFQGGTPVPQFYVSWSTSDTALAHINSLGSLHAPASRANVRVKARTPGGVADSITATFQPVPAQLVAVTGGGQSGNTGQALATPLEVEVRAADNLPVAGVGVRFRAPAGGAPSDTTVTTDSLGRARVTAVLGSAAGSQSFQVNVPAFSGVAPLSFTATAIGSISATRSLITTSAGSVRSGTAVTLTLQGKDAAGNNVTKGGAIVVFTPSGGGSTGTIGTTTDKGDGTYTASFTGVLAGAAATIGATIDGTPVTTALPTITVTPGVISPVTSVVSVSATTVLSGDSATVTLQAKDGAGNTITTGGDTVAFSASGGSGVSTGIIGATVDHGNGTYSAKFTGVLAGSGATIGATVNGVSVASALPAITVTPGAISPSKSVLSVSSGTIASGASATLTLQAKDAAGNNLTSGGATVTFVDSGGTSTGTVSATTDHGNGVYTALFTGITAGTGTTIRARIGATLVTASALITVVPGNTTAAQSIVTVSSDSVASGGTVTLTLQVRDSAGNNITTGGSTVVFGFSGGISTGTIAPSPATDHGNGTYTAVLTGVIAGTQSTVSATLDGVAVTSTLPFVKVLPGPISAATSVVSVSSGTVASGAVAILGLRAKDAAGNNLTKGGATVVFSFSGGTSTGTIGATADSGNGKYTAPFTGLVAGSATTIGATVNGTPVSTALPVLTVTANATASVIVLPAADTVAALGITRQFTAQARDANGNPASDTFTWSSSALAVARVDATGKATAAGNGTATITATAVSNGRTGSASIVVAQVVTRVQITPAADTLGGVGLTAQFTAKAFDASDSLVAGKTFSWTSSDPLVATVSAAGLATAVGLGTDTVKATTNGVTGIALLSVITTTHAADILTNETWTAATSPHIVSGYLRIMNGATLTIEDGATVKFDAGAGLQIGDVASGQPGALVMIGTPGSIHLTANTASPGPGFWKGLEVQKAGAALSWRNVDIEYGGGPRANPTDQSCVLLVDPAANVDLDSLHIRQCLHAGIQHLAGSVRVHRSEVDSVTGAGIQSFAGTLRLDSTAIRGSGQVGLIFGNGSVDLTGAVANKFVGNAAGSVQMFAHQLPGFGRQDSIAGNGFGGGGGGGGVGDTIVVDSGTVGTGVPSFTIFRQPAPYLVTGFLSVWSPTGVTVSLDTGLVMAFDTAAALSVGDFSDSTGASSGVTGNLVSLGTAAQSVVLRNRQGRPGWEGVFLGSQSGTPVVRHIRFVKGGYQPTTGQFCQNCIVKTTGFHEILNSTLWVDAPSGTAPFDIDSVVSDSSHFYGIVVKRAPPQGVRVRDNTIRNATFTGLVLRSGYNSQDVISGNTITGNHYAVDLPADVLPQFDAGANNLAGNVTDTLLLHGGTLAVSDTLPRLGFRWRVTQPLVVDAGAEFTVLAGDTVVFDDPASLTIGGAAPAALHAAGTAAAPILFTVTPGGQGWLGLEFANLLPSTVTNLIVESAGGTVPCGLIDCGPVVVGAVRYSNVSANALTLDAVTIRRSRTIALDVKNVAQSPLTVQNSQFYGNPFSPMIKSPAPLLLSIHGSDLYHYNGQIIQTANAGTDSVDALGNWWGDVGGLEKGFESSDSVGRGSLAFNAVRFDGVVPGPHFPVGPAARIVPATDTILAGTPAMQSIVGDPDSIRARVLDAEGRGVGGTVIGWGTSSGVFQHPGLPTDAGGRAGGVWVTATAANVQFVQATVAGLAGSPVTWPAFLQPGPTVSVNFQLIPALTAGVVGGPKNVSFTSTLRPAALVTNARDQYGNVTAPQPPFYFTDVPLGTGSQNYGLVDSVKHDTVFFHPTVSTPSAFQLHGRFVTASGAVEDSVLINMGVLPAGMRLTADTALYNSACPVGGPYNILCKRTFAALLVDSAGSPLASNPAYQFSWTNPVGSDPTISDSTYGPMNEFADITAHVNGSARLIVQQTAGALLVPDRDTLAITVNQVVANIAVTPDTVSAGLGDTVTFSATATDQGGTPMASAIGWRQSPPAGQYLTIIDYPTASSIRVRIDSAYPSFPRDLAAITVFTERGPGDTVFAAGVIYNPIIQKLAGLGSQPWAVDIDPRTNRAYVADRGNANIAVVDVTGNRIITFQGVGVQPEHVTVDSRNAHVYVSNVSSGTLSVLDAASNGQVLSTIPVGPNPSFVAVDTLSNLAYVAAVCGDPQSGCTIGGPYLLKIDGGTGSIIPQDTVRLPANGGGVAFDAGNRLVYVAMANDSVAIVDPATNTVVGEIGVGAAPQGMAINPLTRKLYVTNMNGSSVSVIDLGTNAVLKTEFVQSNQPQRVAVDPIKNRIYVAGYGNFLVDRIDGNTDTNIGYLSVNCSYPNDVAVNAQNRDLFLPCWSDTLLLTYRYLTHP